MSYILDALKKLEGRRQPGPVPDIATAHGQPPKKKGGRLWACLLAGAFFLGSAISLVWLNTRMTEVPEAEVASRDIPTPKSAPLRKDTGGAPLTVISSPGPAQKTGGARVGTSPVRRAAAPKTPAEMSRVDSIRDKNTMRHEDLEVTPPDRSLERSGREEISAGAPETDPVPDDPAVKISGHVYSDDPALRLVVIDNAIRREGELLGEGLKLEEITPEGAVLSYGGRTFRVRR